MTRYIARLQKALSPKLMMTIITLSMSLSTHSQDLETLPEAPDNNPRGEQNEQNGNLNNNQQDVIEGSYNKTYNGAGSSGMPASSAISPSLMSSGSESCLQSISGGLQLIGVGVSTGKYIQDTECNRRRDSITLSNMGMKGRRCFSHVSKPQCLASNAYECNALPCDKIGFISSGEKSFTFNQAKTRALYSRL